MNYTILFELVILHVPPVGWSFKNGTQDIGAPVKNGNREAVVADASPICGFLFHYLVGHGVATSVRSVKLGASNLHT